MATCFIIEQMTGNNKINNIFETEAVFNRHEDNGGPYWSRTDGDIHVPSGYSTIDTLFVLGELGLSEKDNSLIRKAVDFIFTYQSQEGCFKYSLKSSKLPCITARVIAALGRLGVQRDQGMEKGFTWLIDKQWEDGGWRCPTVKPGRSPLTDASNPGTTLYVLDAFRFRKNNSQELKKLDKGVDFLLQHWEVRQPVGPCAFGIGTIFHKIEYPFLRYNIFYYVYVLSFYEKARKDKRFREAYQTLAGKIIDGKLEPENPHRAWNKFSFAKKGHTSETGTYRWTEIKNNLRR